MHTQNKQRFSGKNYKLSDSQQQPEINDFTKYSQCCCQVIFYCPLTDSQPVSNFLVGQTFLTAHPIDLLALGRHLPDCILNHGLKFTGEQLFFFRLSL